MKSRWKYCLGAILACVAIVILTLVVVLSGYPSRPAEQADGEKFSIETTPIGRLLDTPCTRRLFVTRFGAADKIDSPVFLAARHLTIRKLSAFPLTELNELKLRGMQAEFAKLDTNSAECKRQQNH